MSKRSLCAVNGSSNSVFARQRTRPVAFASPSSTSLPTHLGRSLRCAYTSSSRLTSFMRARRFPSSDMGLSQSSRARSRAMSAHQSPACGASALTTRTFLSAIRLPSTLKRRVSMSARRRRESMVTSPCSASPAKLSPTSRPLTCSSPRADAVGAIETQVARCASGAPRELQAGLRQVAVVGTQVRHDRVLEHQPAGDAFVEMAQVPLRTLGGRVDPQVFAVHVRLVGRLGRRDAEFVHRGLQVWP